MIPVLYPEDFDSILLFESGGEALADTNSELLYAAEAGASRTFSTHGLGDLSDAISCIVEEERNGSYELEMEYPIDGLHFEEIALRTIILAKPNFTDDPQPFRIYKITKPIDGICTIYARHISYDMSGIVVKPFSAMNITTALAGLTSNAINDCPFTLSSSRSTQASFSVDMTSSLRSWLGGKEGSLLDVYGGEWHFDRFTATLENSRGADRGVVINYGHNLTDLVQDEEADAAYTGCVAVYIDDTQETRGDIQYIPDRSFDKVYVLDVSGDYESAPSVEQLNAKAAAYLENHNKPSTNITLDFLQSDKLADRVDLCDTVTIYYEDLGVSATAKCIRTKWNVLLDRYDETEFGDSRTNLAETISQAAKVVEKDIVTASEMEQAVAKATSLISGNLGGYVVLNDSDGDSYPDEILVMDTPDITTATKVWRWNNSGLGYSSAGYAGPYGLAMTIDGEIVADYVTSGELDANIIKAGILRDKAGLNYWNMITGELSIQSAAENIANFTSYYAETSDPIAPAWDITGELNATSSGILYDRNGQQLLAEPVYSIDVPINDDPTYKWMRTYVEYIGGGSTVTEATPLFDYYGRSNLILKTKTDAYGRSVGYLSALADYMELTAGQLTITSNQFTLTRDGNATFSGRLAAASGSFSGDVTATSLTLGSGVNIAASNVSGLATVATSGHYSDLNGRPDLTIYVYKDGTIGSTPASGATGFKVSSNGLLQASNAVIWGTIYATAGSFTGAVTATSLTLGSGVTIGASKVSGLATVATSGRYTDLSNRPDLTVYITKNGAIDTIGSNPSSGSTGFKVSSAGLLQASNAIIWGTIYATAGTIGGLNLSSNSITSSNGSFSVTSAGVLTCTGAVISGTITIGGNANTDGVLHAKDASGNSFLTIDRQGFSLNALNGFSRSVYIDMRPDLFRGMYVGESTTGSGAAAFFSPDYIGVKNNNSPQSLIAWDYAVKLTYDSISIYRDSIMDPIFIASATGFCAIGACSSTTTGSPNVYVGNNGYFLKSASSSKRYKRNIGKYTNHFDLSKLYDIDVKSYKYRSGYLSKDDAQNNKFTLGFIAEELEEVFPEAVEYDNEGKAEKWNINILFPALFQLVKEQHIEIENLKRQIGGKNG